LFFRASIENCTVTFSLQGFHILCAIGMENLTPSLMIRKTAHKPMALLNEWLVMRVLTVWRYFMGAIRIPIFYKVALAVPMASTCDGGNISWKWCVKNGGRKNLSMGLHIFLKWNSVNIVPFQVLPLFFYKFHPCF
jgi:hypothetical protein